MFFLLISEDYEGSFEPLNFKAATLEGEINLSAGWNNSDLVGDGQTIGGRGTYADRPTITYAPLVGDKFSRSMAKPIPPSAIFFLIQAGYQADFVFRTCVQAINNIYNRSGSQGNLREVDPEFYRLVSLLLEIQRSGAAGMRVEEGPDQKEGTVFILRKKRLIPEIAAKISTAKRRLCRRRIS